MSILAGCSTIGSAGYHRALAGLQNTPADERLSGVDILRQQICQKLVTKVGLMDMLADSKKDGEKFHQTVLNIEGICNRKGQTNGKKIL